MEVQRKFRVLLHREAQDFLESLDVKIRNKIYQTLTEQVCYLIQRFLRNWLILISGSFGLISIRNDIVC